MTDLEQGAADAAARAQPAPAARLADGPPARRRLHGLGEEALLALELVALGAFAFARPVLDDFGRSPVHLLTTGTVGWWMVAFGLVVTFVPGLAVAVVGAGARRVAGPARPWVHPVLVGLLGAVGVWCLGRDVTGKPDGSTWLLLAAGVALAGLVALRRGVPSSGTFLRIAGVSCAIYLVQFLALSPASGLLTMEGSRPLDAELVAEVGAGLGDDPPDVVFLLFDALPLVSLLDGTGHIDAELYPHFAELAGQGTWYRNSTTVASFTRDAVPALLTGRIPTTSNAAVFQEPDRDNLFMLLGGNYRVQAAEQVTAMCAPPVCGRAIPHDLTGMLGDAIDHWTRSGPPEDAGSGFVLPGAMRGYEDADEWVGQVDLRPGGRPNLVFHHMMLPHEPWRVTADGTPYADETWLTGHHVNDGWGQSGLAVARQRHLLQVQAADRVLGRYLDALRASGTYDDTMIVVTSDHGKAFVPGESSRGVSSANYSQIMWTPLIVKAPGQAAGRIDDSDVRSIDIVPTIARELGVEIPWPVDGVPAGEATDRGDTKPLRPDGIFDMQPDDGETLVELDARSGFAQVLAADAVEGTGPDAVWRRTAHGHLFGQDVGDLDRRRAVDGTVAVRGLDRLNDVDTREPLPLEVVGTGSLAEGTHVAYALNGTIGAVTRVEPGLGSGDPLVHGLVPPWLFVDGRNELTAYVVEGPVGDETLRPLTVEAR